jgi:tetratricopeptide (TPR) repeat protein
MQALSQRIIHISIWASVFLSGFMATAGAQTPLTQANTVQQGISTQGESGRTMGPISLANKTWGVVLNLPGFSEKNNETKPDGRRYFYATNDASGVGVSITLEDSGQSGSATGCRQTLELRLKELQFEHKDSRIWETGDKTYLEYTIPSAGGMPVQQRNMIVCMVHDHVFLDLHLSKVQYKPEDEKLFQQIVDSLSFSEDMRHSSLDYLRQASVFYLRGDFARAIPPYEQALALEKQNRQLPKDLWYVLLDNLGMAYGITGKLEKARQTLEYGIQQDPDYPLFYYNMACCYGEKGDATNAGENLKKAYARKSHTIAGEGIPDPRKDDSFKNLMKNADFRKLVDSLLKEN